ncbi:MAG: phosphopantetheine-binding protein [Oscillospiraceae bacterium]|jgi:acyl carrier protein|nr:phosphopantetheine-binding protein [Oscillospiraceae bacterium]
MCVFERVKKTIELLEEINPDLITLNADLLIDLGIDSISFVNLILLIEKEFGIKYKNFEYKNFTKVQDIVSSLK